MDALSKICEQYSKREERLEKIALALLEQCKSEGLSVSDVEDVCNSMVHHLSSTSLRDGLTL